MCQVVRNSRVVPHVDFDNIVQNELAFPCVKLDPGVQFASPTQSSPSAKPKEKLCDYSQQACVASFWLALSRDSCGGRIPKGIQTHIAGIDFIDSQAPLL